jgi:hypothetical protein
LPSPIPIANTAVVIPTYNERDNILKVIEALLDLYPATSWLWTTILPTARLGLYARCRANAPI